MPAAAAVGKFKRPPAIAGAMASRAGTVRPDIAGERARLLRTPGGQALLRPQAGKHAVERVEVAVMDHQAAPAAAAVGDADLGSEAF